MEGRSMSTGSLIKWQTLINTMKLQFYSKGIS